MPGQGRTVARMQPGVTMLQLHHYLATRDLECSFSPGAPNFLWEQGVSAGVWISLSGARAVGHDSAGATLLPRHPCLSSAASQLARSPCSPCSQGVSTRVCFFMGVACATGVTMHLRLRLQLHRIAAPLALRSRRGARQRSATPPWAALPAEPARIRR